MQDAIEYPEFSAGIPDTYAQATRRNAGANGTAQTLFYKHFFK
jgi:hypothetical protein